MSKHASMALQIAEKKAAEIDEKLSAYDFRPSNWVKIQDDEGCEWLLASAFVLSWQDWYFVFAEHHDTLILHKDEVKCIIQYEQKYHDIKEADKFKPKKYERTNRQTAKGVPR